MSNCQETIRSRPHCPNSSVLREQLAFPFQDWPKAMSPVSMRTIPQLHAAPDLVTAIHQKTDGNPLFVQEYLRLLESENQSRARLDGMTLAGSRGST